LIKFVFRLVCLTALPLFLLVTAGAAQQRPATPDRKVIPVNIAVVDMDAIGKKATAVKGLRRQMASYRKNFVTPTKHWPANAQFYRPKPLTPRGKSSSRKFKPLGARSTV
jgi:hypothetical protein